MRYKYNFKMDNPDSRRDVEKYFYKYGCSKTLKRLKQVLGEILAKHTFEFNDNLDCSQYHFAQYFGSVQILREKRFPFRKDIHIVY